MRSSEILLLKKIIFVYPLVFILFFTSCAGVQNINTLTESSYPVSESGVSDNKITNNAAESKTPGDSFYRRIWNMSGEEGYLFFTGISPKYLDKKYSDEISLKDAAESGAVFDSVFGVSGKITERSSCGTRSGASFNYIFTSDAYRKYREGFEYIFSFDDSNSSYSIFRIKSSMELPDIEESRAEVSPGWIKKLPVIDGYSFSTGVSGRYSSIAASVKNADAASLEDMIKQKNITVFTDSGYNKYETRGIEYAASELEGFYIIRRWWSSDLKYFYSLGMIKEK